MKSQTINSFSGKMNLDVAHEIIEPQDYGVARN